MPAQRIAENLAFINWTLLTALAVGAFGAVVLMRVRTTATRGFLGFSAFCAAGFGLLAHLSDGALVQAAATPGSTVVIDPAWTAPRDDALIAFAILALVYAVALTRPWARFVAGAGLLAGVAALACGALAWGGGPLGTVVALGQDLLLAAATGGVFVAMILGHWYLVTPKLPEAPLILLSRVLFGLVAAQVLLFAASMLLGAGSGGGPFSPLTGPWAQFIWLRLLVGLVFPLVVSWAAIQTARSRSMESATGLLYINVGSIAAGTILAAGLYFGARLIA
ncbi:MAG TPA: hypothetical protein VKR24_05010 [Candidatus Limnocylindrales bacterium]|nr:hypothetical protein [Candidatus Limnocylindrales bacterium]